MITLGLLLPQRMCQNVCRGSRNTEPHVQHYLDMTQTQLFEMFKVVHVELRLGQRSFEKCKPWYVRINTIQNTCCCRYHIEFDLYYHTFAHIRRFLHPKHVLRMLKYSTANVIQRFHP